MDTPTPAVPFKHRLIMAVIPLAIFIIRLIGMTMRIRLIDPHGAAPQARPKQSMIYAFWHNQQLLAAYYFRNFGIRVLVSRSRDGDYIAKLLEHFGFGTVRSSTSSGKINALRGLARELRAGHHAAITPDGPRGPIYQAQAGPIFLGILTGNPVVPFGCAVDKVWRLRSWDRFEIPQPFSRAVIVYGEPWVIPRECQEQEAVAWTKKLEDAINRLQQTARQRLAAKELS